MRKLIQLLFIVFALNICPTPSSANESISDGDKEIQNLLHDMVGKWIWDVDFIIVYLRKSSEMQRLWCGYGWTESDIRKREKFIRDNIKKDGPLLTWDIHIKGTDSLELRTLNNEGERKVKILSEFRKQDSNLIVCKQSPNLDEPLVFRFEPNYIYLMFRMTPDMMQCKIESVLPAEVWLPLVRLKRSEK